LLDRFHELENQEIFFASPKDLNDPLEGFKDIIWRCDKILWSNLLKHYLLCLTHAVMVALISGPDHKFPQDESFVFSNEATLPTREFKELYRKICETFFRHEDAAVLPASLAARNSPVRRDELVAYLRALHLHALNAVLQGFEESGGMPIRPPDDPFRAASAGRIPCGAMVHAQSGLELEHPDNPGIAEAISGWAEVVAIQQSLSLEYSGISLKNGPAWQTIISEFPRRHVSQLEQLLYSDWYTACFVEDPTQAAMWGSYGDGHKGICLKFRAHQDSNGAPAIKLNQIHGMRSGKGGPAPIYGEVGHPFCKVEYKPRFVEIDFFRSLGRLTRPMLRYWFQDSAGNISLLVQDIMSESERWRKRYWEQSTTAITTKLTDWEHEKEFRLTLDGSIMDFTDPSSRKLKYRFEDLQGIIFGIKTPTADKLKIMHIVEEKCRKEGRKEFEFHQAFYSRLKGKMEIANLDLLKFT
jgi:hypothetical protein